MGSTNKNWQLLLNVSSVRERGAAMPATGAYKVKIVDSEPHEKDGRISSIVFKTVVTEGEYLGTEVLIWIGNDTAKVGIIRSWRTALASIGVPAADMDAGDLNITGDVFLNAEGYVYVERLPDAEDGKPRANREFITANRYAQLKAAAAAAPSEAPTMTVTPAPAVNPPAPAARAVVASPAPVAAPVAAVPAMTVPQPTGAAARLRGMAAARQQ